MNVPSGRYFRETVFLLELSTQCDLALKARDRLRMGALLVNDHRNDHDHDKTGVQPVEILRSAHSFLTHAAIVYRLLFSPSSVAGKQFAERLRRLTDIDQLPKLEHAYFELRHKFEHVDEQLHEFFRDYETSGERYSYEQIRTLPGPSGSGRQFVRWVSPDPLRISFNKTTMHVDRVAGEIEMVKDRINPALEKLPLEHQYRSAE